MLCFVSNILEKCGQRQMSSPLLGREQSGDMLHQGRSFCPAQWKDLDFRCVNVVSNVAAWGPLLFDMLVDVGMVVVFLYMNYL